jgi:signal transduction histidine kinase
MAIVKTGETPFQAYARLISVLGDQLISDKWVGVIELVKNCYDADAENVYVRFLNFENSTKKNPATIEIEDNGDGMTLDTILNVWMKPATPNKLNRKKSKEKRFTKKGRVMQGDKGVGRFAIYKLGDYVELYSKTQSSNEVKLILNFHEYADDEFKESDHEDKFLDEILNKWEVNDLPLRITNKKNKGTLIRIVDVRNEWKYDDLEKLSKAFFRMMPPTLPSVNVAKDFDVDLFWDERKYKGDFLTFEQMADLAPFYFEGTIDVDGDLDAVYTHNNKVVPFKFNLFEDEDDVITHDIRKLKLFKERYITFEEDGKTIKEIRKPDAGGFMFFFYGYDLKNPAEGLKKVEKDFLKETSVYLYRDNVRVYPYGEIGDDWLMLSKYRAEDRAGHYFSYNDLIGFVFITQEDNPKLRDAADREGLMNINGAYDDFVALIQSALKVMKDKVDIDKKKEDFEKQKAMISYNKQFVDAYEGLQKKILEFDDKALLEKSQKLFKATNNLVQKAKDDLHITQELAGTGMAVEKATHDTMSLLKRLKTNTEDFVERFEKNKISPDELKAFFLELEENLEFLYQELQVLQPLFRVARKVTKDVHVKNVVQRVLKYFRKEIEGKIDVKIKCDQDIIVRTNTGLILQVALNLMDNSIYWLEQFSVKDKRIEVLIDGKNNRIVFADNGAGVDDEIKDIIFSEFYTKKAEGRGLGLYIAKELLERINASISLITNEKLKSLKGANFLVQFNQAE